MEFDRVRTLSVKKKKTNFCRPGQLATNRGNYLLINLLQKRHPYLFEEAILEAVQTIIALSDEQRIVLSREEIPDYKRKILRLVSL